MRRIKKAFRILLFILTGIILFLCLSYAVLHSPSIQTRLVKYFTDRIERTTGAKIQIGGVDFRPMASLVLNDVLLKDYRNDTLVYCRDFVVKIDSFNLFQRRFTVSEVIFENAYFNLWIERGQDAAIMNIELFLSSLEKGASPTSSDKEASPMSSDKGSEESSWNVNFGRIGIRNSRFNYREAEYEAVNYGINWTDVVCHNLNVDISDIDFSGGRTVLRVSDLSLCEKSGFEIKELDAWMVAVDSNIVITEGLIRTERSLVDLQRLEYTWQPGQGDWRNFITKMGQYYGLGRSSVSFIDLAFFNERLLGIENTVVCSGVVCNTVNKIEGRNLQLEFGKNSVFRGNFKSSGLPDFWNTLFDINFYDSHITPEDLETVYLPWMGQHIAIPAPLHKLKQFDAEGNLKGTIEDFIVRARSVNRNLQGDLVFKYAPCGGDSTDCTLLSGSFDFSRVNCGLLTGMKYFGGSRFSGSYSGQLADVGSRMNVSGKLNNLGINKEVVEEVDLYLTYDEGKLNLISSVSDDSLRGDVLFTYENADDIVFISTKGSVQLDNLNKLGLALTGRKEATRFSFDAIYAEDNIKNSFCNVSLTDLQYSDSTGTFTIDQVSLENSFNDGFYKTTLKSDIADAVMEGNYYKVRPIDFTQKLIRGYLPAYQNGKRVKSERIDMKETDFYYQIDLKNMDPILSVLYPEVSVSDGAKIYSNYQHARGDVGLLIVADTLRYGDIQFVDSKIDLKGDGVFLKMDYSAGKITYKNKYSIYNVKDVMKMRDNRVTNRLTWGNWGATTYSGALSVDVSFTPLENEGYRTEIAIHPGVIVLADSVWRVNESRIVIDGKEIGVDNFRVGRGDQYLLVNGQISEQPEESISVALKQFDLRELGRILGNEQDNLFGVIDGGVTVRDYYRNNLLYSDINLLNWGVNTDTLGTLQLRSYWEADSNRVIISAVNRYGSITPLRVSGYYLPNSDSLNVDIRLTKVNLNRLAAYSGGKISETSGGLSGLLHISGRSTQPDFSGLLCLDSVALKINELNTHYFISDSIQINNSSILFRDFVVKDIYGQKSVCNGFYRFWEQRYNLSITSDKFLLLDTDPTYSESFYGKVFASGLTRINNLGDVTSVIINARTENSSRLFIPLSMSSSESTSNFLHFVNTGQTSKKREAEIQYERKGIDLNANLELNDNLEVQIVFDPTIGDILKASGAGDIKVTLDKDGLLNMFGEYKITKGDYLFTMSNLLNKKFVLAQGGRLVWNGSPYNAMIDINASYNLKTSLNELISGMDNTAETKSTKVPVECILNLSDNFTNPLVKFDINFPSLDSQTKSYMQGLFSSQDEINKQVFALLIMNKFYTPDYIQNQTASTGDQARTAGVTTVAEMMSSQLTRWLSQISDNFDIGFSYRPGDEITTDEIELALSTQILNDRVTISANGNMDVGNTKSATTNTTGSSSSNIAGDFDIDVKLNRPGTLKLKAYSHTNERVIYNDTEMIQGVGISYQETFDSFQELVKRYFGFLRRKKSQEVSLSASDK